MARIQLTKFYVFNYFVSMTLRMSFKFVMIGNEIIWILFSGVYQIILLYVKLTDSSLGGLLVSVQQVFPSPGLAETKNWKHACAGVLLKQNTVLTSAACLTYSDETEGLLEAKPEEVRIYAGSGDPDNIANNEEVIEVRLVNMIILHPEYMDRDTGITDEQFDFGILLTNSPFSLDMSHQIVKLYSHDIKLVRKRLTSQQTCSTMTWNFYVDGKPIPMNPKGALIKVKLTPIDKCNAALNQSIRNAEPQSKKFLTCIESVEDIPICRIDPGAPIFCEQKLIAVVTNVNIRCGHEENNVVVTGINNAMVFLAEPSLFIKTRPQRLEMPHEGVSVASRCGVFDGIFQIAMSTIFLLE